MISYEGNAKTTAQSQQESKKQKQERDLCCFENHATKSMNFQTRLQQHCSSVMLLSGLKIHAYLRATAGAAHRLTQHELCECFTQLNKVERIFSLFSLWFNVIRLLVIGNRWTGNPCHTSPSMRHDA